MFSKFYQILKYLIEKILEIIKRQIRRIGRTYIFYTIYEVLYSRINIFSKKDKNHPIKSFKPKSFKDTIEPTFLTYHYDLSHSEVKIDPLWIIYNSNIKERNRRLKTLSLLSMNNMTDMPKYNYFITKYDVSRFRLFSYSIFFYFLFYFLSKYNFFDLTAYLNSINIFQDINQIIFFESDFNILVSNYIKDQKCKLHIFNHMIKNSDHLLRYTKGILLSRNHAIYFFGLKSVGTTSTEFSRYLIYVSSYYIKCISENIFSLSNIFLKQYINCFMFFLNKNSYLYISSYLDYLDYVNNLSYNNINLLNNIKDYLFWFSWGIFYNQIFYYYYSTYLIESIDLNIYYYFYYKLEILNFLKYKNLAFIDDNIVKDVQKNNLNIRTSIGSRNFFDWVIGEYNKKWIDYLTFNYFKLKKCFINFTVKKTLVYISKLFII